MSKNRPPGILWELKIQVAWARAPWGLVWGTWNGHVASSIREILRSLKVQVCMSESIRE